MQRELDAQHEDPVPWKPPAAADLASVDAYLSYSRRRDALPGSYFGQIWGPALEADAKESIDVLRSGSVRDRTNSAHLARCFEAAAQRSPDYANVYAPIPGLCAEPTRSA